MRLSVFVPTVALSGLLWGTVAQAQPRDISDSKPKPCNPNGYWVLKLQWLTGTCKPKPIDAHLANVKLLVKPDATQRAREKQKGEESDFDIINDSDVSDAYLVDGTCMVSVSSWPNSVEPWQENYKLSLLEKGGTVTGIGTLRVNKYSENSDIACVLQFTVSGRRTNQPPASK